MIKLMIFIRARHDRDRTEFQRWCLQDYGAGRLRLHPLVRRLVVDLVDVVPDRVPWQRPGEAAPTPGAPPFDVVVETWLEIGADLAPSVERTETFRVTEWVEKDLQPTMRDERSPGVKYIALCAFHDDLTDVGVKRSWAQHVGLALAVHVGASKYVRNWVDEAISASSTEVRGVVELHFKTMADLETRWFDSDRGRDQIIQDVGHFLKSATRMFTSEYVLR
jgi:hypothetical protein